MIQRKTLPTGETCPAVSVLMTVWNGEAYLREAIDSVFAQATNAPWELLIVDDGSTDSSVEIVRQYLARNPRRVRLLQHLRLLQHDGGANRGISASRNLALEAARAPVVAFLDCDDVFLPHHLECQLAVLRQHPEVAMVYASAERWVDHARPFDEAAAAQAWWGSNYLPPLVPPGEHAGVLRPGTLLRWMLAEESLAPCMCTVAVRTAAALAVRGFEDEFHGLYDDQVFHAKLAACFPVFAHEVCTARYRQHADSCCARARVDDALRAAATVHFRRWLAAGIPAVAPAPERVLQEKRSRPRAASVTLSISRG